MRKLQIFLMAGLIIAATASIASAQCYIRVGGGYGLGMGGTLMGSQRTTLNTWTKDVAVNVGQGIPISGELGWMINENVAIEAGAGYTIGMEGEKVNVLAFGGGWGDTTTCTWKGSWIPVTVAVKCKGTLGTLKPYCSVGTGIYFGTVIQRYTRPKDSTGPNQKTEMEVTMTGVNIGANASAGVEFPISDMMSVFAEARFDHVTFSASTAEITKMLLDDVDQLPTWTVNQKHLNVGTNAYLPISADCLSLRGGITINLP